MNKKTVILTVVMTLLLATACSPEVGSKEWCDALKEKPKGEWTANEVADFTKNCIM